MAISLKNLNKVTASGAPRVVMYGVQGVGKTSLAAEFPNPVFLQIEHGTPAGVTLDAFDELATFDAVMEAFSALYSEEHDFKTVVVDTLDALEPLVWAKTCEENRWQNIEDPGYGKGYVAADDTWRKYLGAINALRKDRGMIVVQLAHCDISKFDPPGMEPYNRYSIKLHKRAAALVQEDADFVGFVNYQVAIKQTDAGFGKTKSHAEGSGARVIHTEERPGWLAKNRYGLPPMVPYQKGKGYSAMAQYFPTNNPAGGASSDEAA